MIDMKNWMARLPNTVPLTQLLIPGTHNSSARKGLGAKCQRWSLTEQLNAGVRFLDIRARHFDNQLCIHHGAVYQDMVFGDVQAECKKFLAENPTETILLSLKDEHDASGNAKSYEQAFWDKINAAGTPVWYTRQDLPRLQQVRGQVVLIRRFEGSCGLDWEKFSVQDQYELDTRNAATAGDYNKKWAAMTAEFLKARADAGGEKFHVNFASGYWKGVSTELNGTNVETTANAINPRLHHYLSTLPPAEAAFGAIVPMDFVDNLPRLISRMVLLTLGRHGALPGRSSRIRNTAHNEYLFACANEMFDDSRRYAFTYRRGDGVPNAVWRVIDIGGGKFHIFNEYHQEFLYVGGETFDSDRRHAFTWRPGTADDTCEWTLEPLGNETYRFFNTRRREYLYAAEFSPYDDVRRRVLSWRRGDPVAQGDWKIEWL